MGMGDVTGSSLFGAALDRKIHVQKLGFSHYPE
jgi:hypothetical protein